MVRLILLGTLLLSIAPEADAGERKTPKFSYTLGVSVGYAAQAGPESLRESLERELVRQIERDGCYRTVRGAFEEGEVQAELRLSVLLSEVREESEYDISIAQLSSPTSPRDTANRQTAWISSVVQLHLSAVAERTVIRDQKFQRNVRHRPLAEDDPREEARARLIEEIAGIARRFACKGSSKKLARLLGAAEAR